MTIFLILLFTAIFTASLFLAVRALRRTSKESPVFENVVLAIKVPKEEEKRFIAQKAPLAAEQMFASLHGLLKITPEVQEHLSFEIASGSGGIWFYAVVPKHLRSFVESQIYAQYPNAQIQEASDYVVSSVAPSEPATLTQGPPAPLSGVVPPEPARRSLDEGGRSSFQQEASVVVEGSCITLSKEYFFPIRTFRDFEVDPLAAITGALSRVEEGEEIWIQILLRPVPDVWQEEGYKYIEMVREGVSPVSLAPITLLKEAAKEVFSVFTTNIPRVLFHPGEEVEGERGRKEFVRLSAGEELELKAIDQKLSKMGFETAIRVVAKAPDPDKAQGHLRGIIACFKQFSTANLNSFAPGAEIEDKEIFLKDYKLRAFPEEQACILNTEELASIFHLPSASVETPAISWSLYKRREPPLNLPVENCTFFAKTTFRDKMIKLGIKREDRRRHLYAIGKTGTGKTTMFKNMIIQDMKNGEGVGVLDPHGELIEELLDFVPNERIEDVVLFDPADREHPSGFNMLELPDSQQKSLMASGLIDVFRTRFAFSWGPRLEHILRNCVLTLLAVPSTTLLGVTRLLQDTNYRRYIVHKVPDPVIKRFWEEEFRGMLSNPRLVTEAIAPIQNRLGQFLSSPIIRNIVGQARSSINLGEAMNTGKILLINLSKGKIGVDDSAILGSMLVSRMQFEAMQRVNIPESERRDFYLYVDEFQNFASGAFANILSEARKYHLCLNLTHQYIAQLPEEMRDAVFGNMGTIISFTLGAQDAEILAEEFAPVFSQQDLISLEKYNIYLELMIDGMSSRPFSAVTLPPFKEQTGNKEKVIRRSREKYGRVRFEVEKKIKEWSERPFDLGMAMAEEKQQERKEEKEKPQIKGEIVVE